MSTNLEKKVWQYTKRIPKGKITTYKLLAKAIGRPRASRAVGNALNKNPYSPKVPCHRVVRSDGKVSGFAKGARAKIGLLRKEGLEFKGKKIVNIKKHIYKF